MTVTKFPNFLRTWLRASWPFLAAALVTLLCGLCFSARSHELYYWTLVYFFLLPGCAALCLIDLAAQQSWTICCTSLLVYMGISWAISGSVVHYDYSGSVIAVLLVGFLGIVAGRLLHRWTVAPATVVGAWFHCFWPFLVCIVVAMVYRPFPGSEESTAYGILFFQNLIPLLIFGCSLRFAMQQNWGMCCTSIMCSTIINLVAALIVFSFSLVLTLIAFLAALLGVLTGKLVVYLKSRRETKAE